ncbi:MAG: hypothetical protein ACOYNR_06315 [Blastocatellia bacterium]
MISDYRERWSQYQTAVWEDRWRASQGKGGGDEWIFREYSDLFTRAASEEIRLLHEETPQSQTTERQRLARLRAFSTEGRIWHRQVDLTQELERAFAAGSGEGEDLARERLVRLTEMARAEGSTDYADLRQTLRGIDYPTIAPAAERLLESLHRILRDLPEKGWWESGQHLAPMEGPLLRGWGRLERYRDVMSGIGVRTWQQPGLTFTPQLAAKQERWEEKIDCYPIRVPEEIRVELPEEDGATREQLFWRSVGVAQSYAWTSPQLALEFQHVTPWGDRALELAWAGLFESLVRDRHWLTEMGRVVDSCALRRSLFKQRLLRLRFAAAWFLFSYAALVGRSPGRELDAYLEATGRAFSVDQPRPGCLREVSLTLVPADLLRAAAFEASLRDRLRSAYGFRWWTSRRAGDLLIDLWNTGQRYSIEEMASLIGLGTIDLAWAFDELSRDLHELVAAG